MKKSLPGEIKQKIQDALSKAAALPADSEEHAVHEIRKCIKSVRALLRLLGPTYRPDMLPLIELGRKLSKFRDAEALLETFEDVRKEFSSQLEGRDVEPIREALLSRKKTMQRGEDAVNLVPTAARVLRRVARQIAARPLPDTSVKNTLEKRFRRSKKAFAKANKQPGPETLHDWRKRVKEQFYQLQLLESKSGRVEKQLERLHDIGAWLGDDHNLAVLRDTIFEQPAYYGPVHEVELFLDCAAAHERELRKKALDLGPKIYKHKTTAFL